MKFTPEEKLIDLNGRIETMKALPVKQASGHFDALVDAAIAGEEVVLMRDDQAAVKLVPIQSAGRRCCSSIPSCVFL